MFFCIAANVETNERYFANTRAWVAAEGRTAPLAILEKRDQRLWDLREAANQAACTIPNHEIRRRYLRLAIAIEEYEDLTDLICLASGY